MMYILNYCSSLCWTQLLGKVDQELMHCMLGGLDIQVEFNWPIKGSFICSAYKKRSRMLLILLLATKPTRFEAQGPIRWLNATQKYHFSIVVYHQLKYRHKCKFATFRFLHYSYIKVIGRPSFYQYIKIKYQYVGRTISNI